VTLVSKTEMLIFCVFATKVSTCFC